MSEGIVHVVEPLGDIPDDENTSADFTLSGAQARQRFRQFFLSYHVGNNFIYRDALVRRFNRGEFFIEVDLGHVSEYDPALFENLQSNPADYLSFFGTGAKDALRTIITSKSAGDVAKTSVPDFQVIMRSSMFPRSLRSLTSEHVNRLVKVPGIIISCTRVRAKATLIVVQCSLCGDRQDLPCKSVMGGVNVPQKCHGPPAVNGERCKGAYIIMPDKCEYVDQQVERAPLPFLFSISVLLYCIYRASSCKSVQRLCPLERCLAPSCWSWTAIWWTE